MAPFLQDLPDWWVAWPTLALACGLPRDGQGRVRVLSPAQQCKRGQRLGAPPAETLFVVVDHLAPHTHLVSSGRWPRCHDPLCADPGPAPR